MPFLTPSLSLPPLKSLQSTFLQLSFRRLINNAGLTTSSLTAPTSVSFRARIFSRPVSKSPQEERIYPRRYN